MDVEGFRNSWRQHVAANHLTSSIADCVDRREFAFQCGLCIAVQPLRKHGCINLSEVGVVLQVSILEIPEAGVFANQPRLHLGSRQKHGTSCSMIRAFAGVFLHTPTEFTEAQAQHAFAVGALDHGVPAVRGDHQPDVERRLAVGVEPDAACARPEIATQGSRASTWGSGM